MFRAEPPSPRPSRRVQASTPTHHVVVCRSPSWQACATRSEPTVSRRPWSRRALRPRTAVSTRQPVQKDSPEIGVQKHTSACESDPGRKPEFDYCWNWPSRSPLFQPGWSAMTGRRRRGGRNRIILAYTSTPARAAHLHHWSRWCFAISEHQLPVVSCHCQ